MRSLTIPFVLVGTFGLAVSSFARDVSVGKHNAEEVKASAKKSAESFHKIQQDTIAEPIVMAGPEPIVRLAAKPVRHASPR